MAKSVIFESSSAAMVQVASLLQKYPDLEIASEADSEIVITGWIQIARTFNDFPIVKKVQLEITIPIAQDCFPYVKDTGGHIDTKYPHRYLSGRLCLATEIDLRLHFLDGFDLLRWMDDFVEPYYYSHDYYQRFDCYPFGDRQHGHLGAIQSYSDWFATPQMDTVASILLQIEANDHYRGHHLCFCGSGKKMRDCHGQKILCFYQHPQLRSQLISNLNNLRKELQELDHERNCSSPK